MVKRKHNPGQLGLFIPDSDWKRPTELPDLRGRPWIAIDTENKDDGLASNRGPGWCLGPAGWLCGVSWAAEGSAGYAPVKHPDTDCFSLDQVQRWLTDHFRSGTRIIFFNGPYDLGWLGSYGVPTPDLFEDTACAAVMLDETHYTYNLEDCCARVGIPGKDKQLLADAVDAYGGDRTRPQADLWKLPARYVGPYAEADAIATGGLWEQQEGAIRAQELQEAYRLEIDLIPMVVAMRRRGIRLDTELAVNTGIGFRKRRDEILADIGSKIPGLRRVPTMEDVRSPGWSERVLRSEGIEPPRTAPTKQHPNGQASRSKDWMERHPHWLPRALTQAVMYEEAATKFIDNYLLSFCHRGRIHAEIHQFRSDDGGTRSHRFSYSSPPLQQMPSPDKGEIGKLIRNCFLPEVGELWGACDYSQQEPRITVHFAALCGAKGADKAVARYQDNPRTDYHQMVADMTGMPRPRAKILNLAMTYGKGKVSTAEELGVSVEDAEKVLEEYHSRLPFIKSLDQIAKRTAGNRGYIRLIDGARMRYPYWESGWIERDVRARALLAGKRLEPCTREEAELRQADPDHPWHGEKLRRADTRKALNNLIQGSAARQTKRGMLEMWREGVLPLIQMHDEIGSSYGEKRTIMRVHDIMRDAIKLEVPVIVDVECGDRWGTAKLSWDDAVAKYGIGA